MTFRHIILTRFNLQYEIDSTTHIQSVWLQERFSLFETYCLPSIEQQTCQNFTWLLLSSDQTPEPHRKRLEAYSKRFPKIKIIFCPFYNDCNVLYKKIGEKYVQGYDYLLSTRLDNDDMLEAHFVEIVQRYVETCPLPLCNQIISFPYGIQWFTKDNIAFPVEWKLSHFHTFLENATDVITSLGKDHTLLPKKNLVLMPKKNAWCEIVHNGNICNNYLTSLRYRLYNPSGLYPMLLPVNTGLQRIRFLLVKHVNLRIMQVKRRIKRLCSHRDA